MIKKQIANVCILNIKKFNVLFIEKYIIIKEKYIKISTHKHYYSK